MVNLLFKPVSIVPLVVFRVFFGLLIFLESWGGILTGMVKQHFIDPTITFPFMDFPFLKPLPGNGMYWYFIIMGIFALMIMIGFYYRMATILYFFMWSGVYFMQKSYYNNHYYLLVLFCFIMIFLPANQKFSLDVKLKRVKENDLCPNWCLLIFVVQTSIVYFYASIAKIYPDWLSGMVMERLFKYKADYFLIGSLLTKKWFQIFITYAGIAFDMFIAPALLWSKTRRLAFICSIVFHLFNSFIFQIGIFPYMSILLCIFFFPPDRIKELFSKWIKPSEKENNSIFIGPKKIIQWAFAIWCFIQICLPLRHWLYKGDVVWTEEGHRLAWRMMLRIKGGSVNFKVIDNTHGKSWTVYPSEFLTRSQTNTVATKPDVCWQFVQYLKSHYKETLGAKDLEIYAISSVSLNGSDSQPLYNEKINLAEVEWRRFSHSDWLNPHPSIE